MINRIGEVHSRLTIISFDRREKSIDYYNCKCICGNTKIIRFPDLCSGKTQSCGCFRKEIATKNAKLKTIHGYAKKGKITLEYYSWVSMITRCTNNNYKEYFRYGGRGITVCKEWLKFENFIKDMGDKPGKDYSIDRINNDLGYYKENCRWATKLEQCNNQSSNRKVINTITNEEYSSIAEAARVINMHHGTLRDQLTGKNPNKTNLKLKKNDTKN
jgi:hypothetical protein